ncbi:MAG: hypothetical protein B5M55_04985 [Desulfococcus sp. 4484_242]|nr:MAG: hypothetical protein B5M55_04985 [Desulfococcus sp. 4484_242]
MGYLNKPFFTGCAFLLFGNSSITRGRRAFLKRPARRPGAEEKLSCPGATFTVIPLIIEVIRYLEID